MIGVDFWGGLIDWIKEELLKQGMISKDDLDLFYVTDDISEAVQMVKQTLPGKKD